MVKVVFVTCPPAEAPTLARGLVASGLAACVNHISGVSSVYRWEGSVHEDAESLLMIKTSEACVDALRDAVTEMHSYDTPEFLVLDIDTEQSSPDYLDWVMNNVGSAGS